jgi:putative hemolysin
MGTYDGANASIQCNHTFRRLNLPEKENEMKKNNKTLTYLVIIAAVTLMAACTPTNETEPTEADETMAGLANPAAVYCEGLGYTMETVERNGGEDADCVFPDGSRCAQWDFLAGRCGQAFSYCEQQGGVLEEGGNIGICRFSDGSYCDEYTFFAGECAPGDNPRGVSDVTGGGEEAYPAEPETTQIEIEIQSFNDALDYMVVYMKNEYGFEASEPWVETDITTENATATTTHRYVAGPLTIVISAMASAPVTNYVIDEVSDLTNGFFWRGTLSYDGTVIADEANPAASVLSVENARDAVMAYLAQTYGLPAYDAWTDDGSTQGSIDERPATVRTFSVDSWVVKVTFEPAAPLIGLYRVNVENQSGDFKWEGEITLYGEITEIMASK